jgi:transposase
MAKRDMNLEAQIVTLLSLGYSNPQIAEATDRTVNSISGLINRMRARGMDIPSRRGESLSQWRAAKATNPEES